MLDSVSPSASRSRSAPQRATMDDAEGAGRDVAGCEEAMAALTGRAEAGADAGAGTALATSAGSGHGAGEAVFAGACGAPL